MQQNDDNTNKVLIYNREHIITPSDVIRVHRIIESYHNTSNEVKEIQKELLINTLCTNKEIFMNNRIVYFGYVTTLVNIGFISNDSEFVNNAFNALKDIKEYILSLNEYSFQDKVIIFDQICNKYSDDCNKFKTQKNSNLKNLKKELDYLHTTICKLTHEPEKVKIKTQNMKLVKQSS